MPNILPPPPSQDHWFLTDGGIETVLTFEEGLKLPEFAAFVLLRDAAGRAHLTRYFRRYLELAVTAGTGFVLESPTWRAGWDWSDKLGFDGAAMRAFNRDAIALLADLRAEYARHLAGPIVVSGCIGPRGDAYVAGAPMTLDDAERVHRRQVEALASADVDLITAITMTTSAEAIGVARAAGAAHKSVLISFTVETDGRLPSGETLPAAIDAVDADALATGRTLPAYSMLNCAHPSHFEGMLAALGTRRERLKGVRANASSKSHAELDAATELAAGDPRQLSLDYVRLKSALPALNVLGGCCGTNHRHVAAMAAALVAPAKADAAEPRRAGGRR